MKITTLLLFCLLIIQSISPLMAQNISADKVSEGITNSEGGRAISDVIFGDYNPNGKLPYTYPRTAGYHTTYNELIFENQTKISKNPFFIGNLNLEQV